MSLMRLRGMECNSPSGYAEAFYCRKASSERHRTGDDIGSATRVDPDPTWRI